MAPHTSCISTGTFYNKNQSNKTQRSKLNGGNSASLNALNHLNRDDRRQFFNTPRKKNHYYDRRSPSHYSKVRTPPFNRSPNKRQYEYARQIGSQSNQAIKKRKLSLENSRHYMKDDHPMKKTRSNSEEDYYYCKNNSINAHSSNRNDSNNHSSSNQQKQFNSDGTSLSRNPFNSSNNGSHDSAEVNTLLNQNNERIAFRNKTVTIDEVRNEDKENAINSKYKNDLLENSNNYPTNNKLNRYDGNQLENNNQQKQYDHLTNHNNSYAEYPDYYRGSRMTNDWTNDDNTYQSNVIHAHKAESLYPVALRNLGNTCYMNSIIQPMFNLPFLMCELRDSMERASLINAQLNFAMTKSLIELFEEYKRMRRTQSSNDEELEKRLCAFKYNVGQHSAEFKSSGQHDAVEFLDSVINSIDEEFDKVKKVIPNCRNPVNKVFKIEIGETSHCEACNLKSNIVRTKSHCLILSLPEEKYMEENSNWNLQQILRNYFKPEKRESKCEKCGNKERNRHLSVMKSPRVLILQLGRYSAIGEKRHEPIKVPFEITLPKVNTRERSTESAPPKTNEIQDNQFELSGVICHHGSCPAGGHYICYIHDRLNNEWYHCDDENIVQTTFERVQEGSKSSGYCFFYLNSKYV